MGNVMAHASWQDTCITSSPRIAEPPAWHPFASSRIQGVGVDGWRAFHFPSVFLMPNICGCIPWVANWETKHFSKEPNKFVFQSTKNLHLLDTWGFQKHVHNTHCRCFSGHLELLRQEESKGQRTNGANRTFILLWVCNVGSWRPYHVKSHFWIFQDFSFYSLLHCDKKKQVNVSS